MIKYITSNQNEFIKYAVKLKETSTIKEEKKFLIEGFHLLEMANDYLECVFTEKPLNLDEKITQYIVNDSILKKLSSGKSISRVVAICRLKEVEIDLNAKIIVYLDGVQDPGNVGTIFRTCLAFGIKDIFLSEDSAFLYNSKVIQASQGSIFDLNIKLGNIVDLFKKQKEGYKILSTTLNGNKISVDNYEINDQKVCIVMGNEGQGIQNRIIDMSDASIYIPINNIDSLNVAISFGIFAYIFSKRLNK